VLNQGLDEVGPVVEYGVWHREWYDRVLGGCMLE
jgi:hypothetical protein